LFPLKDTFMNKELDVDCGWPGADELMRRYHDEEWGVPLHSDQKLFEFMILDAFQAGLSWKTVLHKRENFRRAFDNFDVAKIALYDEEKIYQLMQDASIIRNQAKIRASVINAQAFYGYRRNSVLSINISGNLQVEKRW